MRVADTTTSLIFSKYGSTLYFATFLDLICKAQYQIVQGMAASHGDGPVSQPDFEWVQERLSVEISRSFARLDLTWLMLADTLEGLRVFFIRYGWFETTITVLDDTAGPVGYGSVKYRVRV